MHGGYEAAYLLYHMLLAITTGLANAPSSIQERDISLYYSLLNVKDGSLIESIMELFRLQY